MSWEEELKNEFGWMLPKEFKNLKKFIVSLLRQQRKECVENILMGFGVGTIQDYQIFTIKKNGLKAPEPGVKK